MEFSKSLAPHTGKVFEELQPVYDVSVTDIQEYIKQKLLEVKK